MKEIFNVELVLKILIEVIVVGFVVFFVQSYFQNKWKPLTAAETLKKENFLNAKRDVYFEAIELANRVIGQYELRQPGEPKIKMLRNIGAEFPTEFEVNTCFAKLCIYSDNKEIIRLFKEIIKTHDETKPVAALEDFVNLLRKDLGYGEGIIESYEYEYIQIVRVEKSGLR